MQCVGQIQSAHETYRVSSAPGRSYGVGNVPGTGSTDTGAAGPKELVEERRPIGEDKLPISSLAQLTLGLAIRIPIHHDDGTVIGLPARFGLGQLRRVERAVATATDHDDVPQRMSLPPSTTSTVPVA